jgi:signal transduction histidine kinase
MGFTVTLSQGPTLLTTTAARAHAMKNCVAVLVAMTYLLEKELDGAARERCACLRATAGRLKVLLAETLRGEAPCDASDTLAVETIVSNVLERAASGADRVGVLLKMRCEGGSLVGRRAALEEALYNVVANAIDATPPGGVVELETSTMGSADHVWVVRDSGSGIPDDAVRDLGRPFASRKQGGSGIGLAFAVEVIAAHGGMFRVESSAGIGTAITISLPTGSSPR